MLPALLGLLMMGVAGGDLPNTSNGWWLFLWTIGALILALFNVVAGLVQANEPRPQWIFAMSVSAALAVITCPIVWG